MEKSVAIAAKIRRLDSGEPPRVLDLFAGCGGLSLGFKAAGFLPTAGIESEPHAAASYGWNLHGGLAEHCAPVDITEVSPAEFCGKRGWRDPESSIDVIVGGPPCQAFARIGRPKLRDITANPRAFLDDDRARLYLRYLEYVHFFRPLALLLENVPDAMNHGGQNIASDICEALDSNYATGYTLLNAARFGVPQMRERLFLIAYRRELGQRIYFPVPTHNVTLPPGYAGIRHVAVKTLDLLDPRSGHFITPESARSLPISQVVTVEQAIGDLPALVGHLPHSAHEGEKARRPLSSYAIEMRSWAGYPAPPVPVDHLTRRLPRDWPIFERMNPGDQYPQAHSHALEILRERALQTGIKEGSQAFEELRSRIVPPYSVHKFHGKWRKLRADTPAHTLTAHLGKDTYSHIHYDSSQARTITVREAARLQSFPDGFRFSGGLNSAFRQIGNAVPPLLARALATTILNALQTAGERGLGKIAGSAGTPPHVAPVTVLQDGTSEKPRPAANART